MATQTEQLSPEDIEAQIELERKPGESYSDWLARLESETAEIRKLARKEEREAAEAEQREMVESARQKIMDILTEIEMNSDGRVFRNFSFMYKSPKPEDWDDEVKMNFRLIRPRQRD